MVRERIGASGVGPGDTVLALGLLAFAFAELTGLPQLPRTIVVPAAIAMTVPLLWRRRSPLFVVVIVVGAFAVQTLLGIPDNAQLASLAAILVACFSLGAHAPRTRAVVGVLFALASTGLTVALEPVPAAADFGFVGLVVGGAWAVGRLVRARTHESHAHQRRADELAAASEERARLAAEGERRRIARELHDIVAHSLSLMVVQAGGAEQIVRTDPDRAAAALGTIQATGRQALIEMKRLLGLLREPEGEQELRPQPHLDHLAVLVEQVRAAGVPVELRVEGPRRPLGEGVESSVFRVAQEALTNVMKHASGAQVDIRLHYGDDELRLEITNDGPDMPHMDGAGRGLVGMRERTELLDGELEAGPRTEGGFRVHARFPLQTPTAP